MNTALNPLIENYCNGLAESVPEIAGCLDRLRDGTGDAAAHYERALDLVHQINGMSGTMGYPQISDAARELEHYMRKAGAEDGLEASSLHQMFKLFMSFETLAICATPEMSRLFNVDLAQFARRSAG
jgi:HPt (histidine-containing phosphotransfer) domain-containing protein